MIYRFGTFELDTRLLELRRSGASVPIVPRAFDALRLLIENRDRVVGKDELIAAVWQGRIVSEETIASCISAVRRAVGDSGKRQEIIRTAQRRGFRMVAPVVEVDGRRTREGLALGPGDVADRSISVDRSAVAILPFETLSGDPSLGHFVESMRKSFITAFWRWRLIPVIALDPSDANASTDDAADRYGARYLLKGSVREVGGRVRIAVQLIDAFTGHVILAELIERRYAQTFAFENGVTNEIVGRIAPKLERIEYARVRAQRPATLDPNYLVRCGMGLLDEYTKEGNIRARALFREALDLEPSYSRAFAGIALARSRALMSGYEHSRETAAEAAVEAGHRAVGIDGSDAFAYNALCMSYLWARRNGDALASVKEAVRLNPSYGHARGSLGDVLVRIGRAEEGIETMKDALRQNPHAPNLRHFNAFLARACIAARRHDEAVHWAKRAIHLRSDLGHAYCLLAAGLGHLGRVDDARMALDRCRQEQPDFFESAVELRPHEDAGANRHLLMGLYKAGWQD